MIHKYILTVCTQRRLYSFLLLHVEEAGEGLRLEAFMGPVTLLA